MASTSSSGASTRFGRIAGSFKNMRTATKLWSAFLVLVVMSTAIIALAAYRINELSASIENIAIQQHEKVSTANDWKALNIANAIRFTSTAVSGNPAVGQLYKKDMANAVTREAELVKKLQAFSMDAKEKELFDTVLQLRKEMDEVEKMMRELVATDKVSDAFGIYEVQYQPRVNQLRFNMDEFVNYQQEQQKAHVEQAQKRQRASNAIAVVLLVVLPAFGLLCAWAITRSIQRPLLQAVAQANAVASGDLTQQIAVDRDDEFGALMGALQHMTKSLSHVVAEVRGASQNVTVTSGEVATGNSDLSARTEMQAASLQETAASVSQLTTTVKQNSESADRARQLSSQASDVAKRGGEIVGQVVQTMGTINDSSKRIVDIISVIDGIAFQTNILALNAAVEAARAGENGRGFAVVASEVRALAQRSAAAAREIKELISVSVERVTDGKQLVDRAGQTMSEIVTSVQTVADLILEISAANREQANGIGEINRAVAQLDHMTQQNAALVEQSTAAAESLRVDAGRLQQSIGAFKLAHA